MSTIPDEDGALRAIWSLGTYDPNRKFIDADIALSENEWSDIKQAVAIVDNLQPSWHYTLLEKNFAQLEATTKFVSISLSLGRRFATIDTRQVADSLITSLVNWLLAMRLYLDHQQVALTGRFGRASTQMTRFETTTSRAYDSLIGYRFCYRLRNYVRRIRIPSGHIEATPSGAKEEHQKIKFYLERDGLLSAGDLWGSVAADLRSLPDHIEYMQLAREAMDGLRAVADECIEIALDDALLAIPLLAKTLDRIEATGKEGQAALVHAALRPDGKVHRMRPQMMPVESIRTLQEVAAGSRTRESLRVERQDSAMPLDPSAVRIRFHRDSRGVQALAAWLAGDGFDQQFTDLINDIIRQDRSASALITGLIEVAAVVASMCGSLLGSDAQTVVTNIIDMYSPYSDDDSADGDEGLPEN